MVSGGATETPVGNEARLSGEACPKRVVNGPTGGFRGGDREGRRPRETSRRNWPEDDRNNGRLGGSLDGPCKPPKGPLNRRSGPGGPRPAFVSGALQTAPMARRAGNREGVQVRASQPYELTTPRRSASAPRWARSRRGDSRSGGGGITVGTGATNPNAGCLTPTPPNRPVTPVGLEYGPKTA